MCGTVRYGFPNECKRLRCCSTVHSVLWLQHSLHLSHQDANTTQPKNALVVLIDSTTQVTMTTAHSFIKICSIIILDKIYSLFFESFRGPTRVGYSETRFCRFLDFFSGSSLRLFVLKLRSPEFLERLLFASEVVVAALYTDVALTSENKVSRRLLSNSR